MAELIIPERYREAYYKGLKHYLETGEGPVMNRLVEFPALRSDYTEFLAELSITRVSQTDPPLFTGVIRDITERKRAEQELQFYASKLEQSNKELEHFATIASHDLQAPLRKVKMFSDYLAQSIAGKREAEELDYIFRLQKSVQRMQTLIDDLLDLSRVNRRGQPFRKIEFSNVVRDVLEELYPYTREVKGHIEVDADLLVEVDPAQLHTLLLNLVENALKFHVLGEFPIIRIAAVPIDSENYEITIQDDGIGIKPEHQERIFEVFQRLHGESQYSGTGMGLAICKKIAERHGGSITVESEFGRGSTFKIKMPFSPGVQQLSLSRGA